MNVASRKLCEELYKLSGWHDGSAWTDTRDPKHAISNYPKYNLGYLLRKLPGIPEVKRRAGRKWAAVCRIGAVEDGKIADKTAWTRADTPEDAVCKLAIELFKQGILKKSEE